MQKDITRRLETKYSSYISALKEVFNLEGLKCVNAKLIIILWSWEAK